MEKRLHGYQRAVGRSTLPELVLVMNRAHGGEQAQSQIFDWIDKHTPEAVLCGNDDICFEAHVAAERLGRRIPEDLALITFDDLRWFQFSSSPITAVRQPAAKIGEVAIRILLNAVKGKRKSKPREIFLDTELVIRSSCGKHPQRPDEQRSAE
jgi:DNA-binding LacI/PurR family transcriptional regulator